MSFGEATEKWIEHVTGVDFDYRDWSDLLSQADPTLRLPKKFRKSFMEALGFSMWSEAGRRIILNLFLGKIISDPLFEGKLRVFLEYKMEVVSDETPKRILGGVADYVVGFHQGVSPFELPPRIDLNFVAVEAKRGKELTSSDIRQCVAEVAALHKLRKDAEKPSCAVWGAVTNACRWRFIRIDDSGKLFQSRPFDLDLELYNPDQALTIYRLLFSIIKCCFESATPNSTSRSNNN